MVSNNSLVLSVLPNDKNNFSLQVLVTWLKSLLTIITRTGIGFLVPIIKVINIFNSFLSLALAVNVFILG